MPSLNSTLNENKSLHLQDSDEDILKINASEDRYMDSDVDLKISKENQISEELTINKDVNFGDELEKKKSLGKESDLFSESLQENNAFSVEQLSAPASIQADKSIKRASMNVKTKSLSSDEEWIDLFYTAL